MRYKYTAERVKENVQAENFVFQRSVLAYLEACKLVHGNVLELGTGDGYAVKTMSKHCSKYVTIDKFENKTMHSLEYKLSNVSFVKMKFPPLMGIPDNFFGFVVCFQVIEHIPSDNFFVKEIFRVLKPNGTFIVTTPNAERSLTRNPYHVREYSSESLQKLLSNYFAEIKSMGIAGNQTVEEYYEKNKLSVNKILKYDLLELNKKLPSYFLRIPYDIGNYLNRRYLFKNNTALTQNICCEDYRLETASSQSFDLFFIATKH